MTAAIFLSLSLLTLYGFMTLQGSLLRPLYLKLSFDFAAVAMLGFERAELNGEVRILAVCFVVLGLCLTFLNFLIERQKDSQT